ncbi:MAG: hypothetical protein FJW30_22570 [Acidobacteria bacterium]|nr:hypothetical protein [Acidobacteriota bacterium]
MRLFPLIGAALLAQNPLVFENPQVRVVKAANLPGQKSRPHVHLVNRVMVHLDKGTLQIAYPDGTARDIPFIAGQVRWDPKVGTHTSENTGGTAIKIVEVEMKNEPPSAIKLSKAPKKAKVEMENSQVRVLRAESLHGFRTKAPQVAIRLSDGHAEWRVPGPWQTDLGGEMIVIEVK